MTEGEASMGAKSPALFIIKGCLPYLWIGNDAADTKGCFATISGKARLRRIAQAILKASR